MRIFLSYRRDDTGGRAGRLYDQLATRFGTGRVFIDVTDAAPGLDFTEQVETAIERSDAVLVVIGPEWLASPRTDGTRRIDRADDFVRREVGAALTTGKPVVPVLVDGATLPSDDQLPDDIRALATRQAVSLRDTSWHEDVNALVRRLEGDTEDGSRSNRKALAVAGVVAIIAVVTIVVLVRAGDDDGESSDGETPRCAVADGSWADYDVVDGGPTSVPVDDDVSTAEIEVQEARSTPDGDGDLVIVTMSVANVTDPAVGGNGFYAGTGAIGQLLVDGIDQGDVTCMSVQGDPQVEPGERVIASVGFRSTVDPTDAAIAIEAYEHDFPVTTSAAGS